MAAAGDARVAPLSEPRELYPYDSPPFDTGYFETGDGHEIYYEQWGNPEGKPAIFLHGGPGSGCGAKARGFFNPAVYRVVLMDQRGAGRSRPFASLENNTTWHLVADIERLRERLGIEKWLVFGGSWGSTLALSYASKHADRITHLVLRGIFTIRKKEIDFFYQEGSSFLFPDAWEDYLAPIPAEERGDLVTAYHKRLTSEDEAVRLSAAKAWTLWEGRTSKLLEDPDFIKTYEGDKFALSFARIENHYFFNKGFFETDAQLIDAVPAFRHIPAVIVQGRYDLVCPMATAWDLHRAWPEAKFTVIPDAGHSAFEAGIQRALLEATDAFGAE